MRLKIIQSEENLYDAIDLNVPEVPFKTINELSNEEIILKINGIWNQKTDLIHKLEKNDKDEVKKTIKMSISDYSIMYSTKQICEAQKEYSNTVLLGSDYNRYYLYTTAINATEKYTGTDFLNQINHERQHADTAEKLGWHFCYGLHITKPGERHSLFVKSIPRKIISDENEYFKCRLKIALGPSVSSKADLYNINLYKKIIKLQSINGKIIDEGLLKYIKRKK